MKRYALIALALAAVAGANAAVFSNDVVTITKNGAVDGAATFSLSSAGDSHSLNIDGLTLNGANFDFGDVAWGFDFDATPNTYTTVRYTIEGTIAGMNGAQGSADIFGNEKVYDTNANLVGDGVINETVLSNADGSVANFAVSVDIPFTNGIQSGKSLKDSVFFTDTELSTLTITKISQDFNPVPEPASMAALGLGVAALIRRRKSRN